MTAPGRTAGRRFPLPWPGPGTPPHADGGVAALGRLLLRYAPTRVQHLTLGGARAFNRAAVPWPAPPLETARTGPLRGTPSGGAIYPAELYVAWRGTPDLPAGLYHLDALHHALVLRCAGERGAALAGRYGTGSGSAADTLIVTCRAGRTVHRYGPFGYRLALVDTGVLIGQLLAGTGGATSVFFDLAAVALGVLLDLDPATEPVQAALSLGGKATVAADPGRDLPAAAAADAGPDLAAQVLSRRSATALGRGMTEAQLMAALSGATHTVPADVAVEQWRPQLHVVAMRVSGLRPGVYRYAPEAGALHRRADATAAAELPAAMLSLDARLLTAGASVFVTMAIPEGDPRRHRIALLLAGLTTQWLCLAGGAAGLASRPMLGFHRDPVHRVLGLGVGRMALSQVVFGLPTPPVGQLDLMSI